MKPILEVENLSISFETLRGSLTAVRDISFTMFEGETLGVVGESGCGKSLTSLAVMGLLPDTALVKADKLNFQGIDLLSSSGENLRKLRGNSMSMIFQDPMTSLNPSFTVEYQIDEILKAHNKGDKAARRKRAIELLDQVGIPDPESRLSTYPHELSGGMSQRVMIAIAMACEPDLLIADEPTTALDVTIQAQILSLLQDLQKKNNMSLMLITHDIGVVAEMADRIQVMYAGEVVESGASSQIIAQSRHPYTSGLLKSLPSHAKDKKFRERLYSIDGVVPDLVNRPTGCQFHPRCSIAKEPCDTQSPALERSNSCAVRCFYPQSPLGGI